MNKVIIPRKDHEAYFLPVPEGIKNIRQIRQYVNTQMEKLHPAFSSRAVTDIKRVSFNGKAWLMVTVMDEELLAEYRVLHNRPCFFTNTSIIAGKKNFTSNGIKTIGDEKIGFDAGRNEPVSVPLETGSGKHNQETGHEKLSRRYSVFREKTPVWLIPVIGTGLSVLLIIAVAIFTGNSREKTETSETASMPPAAVAGQQEPETVERATPSETVPQPIVILASTAARVVNSGGKIAGWHSNIDSEPFMLIQLQGINIMNVRRIFGSYGFATLEDIKEIRYGDNGPHMTALLRMNKDAYSAADVMPFPMQGFTFPMIGELSNFLGNTGIAIISETLPSAGNNYLEYTVNFQAAGWNLIRSLEIISIFCERYSMQVRKLDIQITSTSLFTASITLSHCDSQYVANAVLGSEKNYIPAAFGFLEEEEEIAEGLLNIPVLGSIRDSGGVTTFYRSIDDGKIRVRVENER